MPQQPTIQFSEKMNFPDIIMEQIKTCMKARTASIPQYCLEVETLCDSMISYWDKEFMREMKEKELKPDLSNPYFDSMTPEKKEDAARAVFRCVMKLIQRSGFISEKQVEGVLDERTIDEIAIGITRATATSPK